MTNFLRLFFLAVALSMDTFSLSLGIGSLNVSNRQCLKISLTVGIMHFLMPFLGNIIGSQIVSFFQLNSNIFLGCILLFIAINLLIETHRNEEQIDLDFSFFGIFLFSFGVSIDAFSTGLGLSGVTNNHIIAMTIFSIVSFLFTYGGLKLGKYAYHKLGKKANILGILLLLGLGIFHICK